MIINNKYQPKQAQILLMQNLSFNSFIKENTVIKNNYIYLIKIAIICLDRKLSIFNWFFIPVFLNKSLELMFSINYLINYYQKFLKGYIYFFNKINMFFKI